MNKLLPILLICSIGFTQEMEVDGNLKVTGTIQASTIDSLLSLIAQLEMRIAQLECQNIGNFPAGYCDCYGNTLDSCGICGGDTESEEDCPICLGLIEVELWGVTYDIATTTAISLHNQGLTGSIPPEIGCLTNLTILYLHNNQLTGSIPSEIGNLTNLTDLVLFDNQLSGDIPQEVCDLIENNNLNMSLIVSQNNFINTCD